KNETKVDVQPTGEVAWEERLSDEYTKIVKGIDEPMIQKEIYFLLGEWVYINNSQQSQSNSMKLHFSGLETVVLAKMKGSRALPTLSNTVITSVSKINFSHQEFLLPIVISRVDMANLPSDPLNGLDSKKQDRETRLDFDQFSSIH
ncbi:hypothetical protein M8C21_006847, partial [Ambrosia artemisiifolia]